MKYTLFISDLHLQKAQPQITDAFLQTLQKQAVDAEKLYILGDFFNYWVGDDDPNPFLAEIEGVLREFSKHHSPVYLLPGNRDFLLNETFAKRAGITLLKDPTVIDLYGTPTLLTHGDALCTLDKGYQRFRQFTHQPWFKAFFRQWPLGWRVALAERLRSRSKQTAKSQTTKPPYMVDVAQETVEMEMQKYGVSQMIHGHTHQPGIHHFTMPDETGAVMACKRIVLGSWEPVGAILKYGADGEVMLG